MILVISAVVHLRDWNSSSSKEAICCKLTASIEALLLQSRYVVIWESEPCQPSFAVFKHDRAMVVTPTKHVKVEVWLIGGWDIDTTFDSIT